MLEGIDDDAYFYFAHSFAAIHQNGNHENGDSAAEARATCTYGTEFVAVAEKENIFAVQFHPEKSGEAGQRVLQNFVRLAA